MRPVIILFTAFLTFSGGAFALSMSAIIKQAEVIKVNAVTAATSTAITVSTTIRGFAANDPYQIKSLSVPKATYLSQVKKGFGSGSLGSLAKDNAWYAGFIATVYAAGWAINELSGQMEYHPPLQVSNGFPAGTVFSSCILLGSGGASIVTRTNVDMTACLAPTSSYVNFKLSGNFVQQGSFYQAPITYCFANTPSICWPTGYVRVASPVPPSPIIAPAVPVPDDSLYDSLISHMLQDPVKAADAFMVPDPWPYPYPEVFPDTVPYIPGVTQSDQELLDLYAQGLLQSTNPNAAHYVSPEKLAEIAALAGQLQAGVTPQALVDAANQAAQAPVTQAQLEELMKKQEAAEAKADAAALEAAKAALAPATTALDQLNDEKTELEDMISDSPTANPPSSIPDIFDWTLPTGNCQPYPFTFTIQAGSAQADDDGAFCRTYNEVAHPLIFWFLNMLTAVYIFGIWSRTMTSVVGGR